MQTGSRVRARQTPWSMGMNPSGPVVDRADHGRREATVLAALGDFRVLEEVGSGG